jgi:hypothetical protein
VAEAVQPDLSKARRLSARRALPSHHAAVCAGKELFNNAVNISTRIRTSIPYPDPDLKYNFK